MNAIRNVFNAFTNLAASVNALAGVVDAASARLRQQLALEETPPLLPRGEVLEHDAESASSAKRNGRAKASA